MTREQVKNTNPPGLPIVWPPLVALGWLSAGPFFRANSPHFGWGFFPTMAWLLSLVPFALFFGLGTLLTGARLWLGDYGTRRRFWRLGAWLVAAVSFAAVAVVELRLDG